MKRLIALLLCLVFILSAASCGKSETTSTDKDKEKKEIKKDNREDKNDKDDEEIPKPEIKIGDTVYFGRYEQDNDMSNGKERIEWIVLAKEDGKAFVISKYELDRKPYNEVWENTTWEECTLRGWLNDDFYNVAFNESEKEEIETTYVVNNGNGKYGTEGGNNTNDKIFLLSIEEVQNYFSSNSIREPPPDLCQT